MPIRSAPGFPLLGTRGGWQPVLATIHLSATNDLVDAIDDLSSLVDARAPVPEVEAALDAVDARLSAVLGGTVPSGL